MYLPNYKDGGIVNLMSSIELALKGNPRYRPLKILPSSKLSKSKNIVLLIIDGLGYEYLRKHRQDTIFNKHKINKIISVFPATTATAITTVFTGVAPQQHAITGWYMYLKELGIISVILPFVQKDTNTPLERRIRPNKIFNQKSFFEKIKAKSFVVTDKNLYNSSYTHAYNKKAKVVSYNKRLSDYFKQIEKIIKSNNCKKYICAYWHKFDGLCHKYGVNSKQTLEHFKKINTELTKFLESIKDATIIITADHGFTDTTKSRVINLADHPKLKETLMFPVCGEARFVYCYVRPSRTKDFENYIKEHFKNICCLYKNEELIKKNYFGLFKPNEKLLSRIGDYTLIMKDNYIIKNLAEGEKLHFDRGNHGGVSKEEMFVPLVIINK